MRIQLVAAVSLAPLMMASGAAAQTVISNERTTPVVTSTVNNGAADNVRLANGGTIRLTTGTGVTINSNNTFTMESGGRIVFENAADGATGVLINGGVTTTLNIAGQITITDNFTSSDTDGDGDLDGAFATGTGRYGVRVTGAGNVTGDLILARGSTVTIEGNQSAGMSLESGLIGNLHSLGNINVLGDQSYGLRTTGAVTGNTYVGGQITTAGAGSIGVSIENTISGRLTFGGNITSTGFRYTSGVPASALALLDADDLLIGGPAVNIASSVGGGVLFALPYANDPNNTDDDGDGILDVDDTDSNNNGVPDASEGAANIISYGSAPAVQIGSSSQAITLGLVGTGTNAYGLINEGTIGADGVYSGFAATGLRVGLAGGQTVTVDGGFRNAGTIRGLANNANARAVVFEGANIGRFDTSGLIQAAAQGSGAFQVTAVDILSGSTLNSFSNSGSIQSVVSGAAGSAFGVRDLSGTLTSLINQGRIEVSVALPTGETGTITGTATAIDVRANTTGVTVMQDGINDGDDNGDGVADPDADGDGVDDDQEPAIFGDILFGSGADALDVRNGTIVGRIAFGDGADTLSITGGASVAGAITDSDGLLQINVTNGILDARQSTATVISGMNVGANGDLIATFNPAAGVGTGGFIVNGTANFANGAGIGVRFNSLLTDPTRFVVVQATTLNTGTLDQSQVQSNSPFMYVVNGGVDTTLNQIYVDARQRTSAEFGFISAEDAAYAAFYNNLSSDSELMSVFLSQTGRDGFFDLYEQMLPDHSGGQLMSLATGVDAVTRGLAGRGFPAADGETSAWLQEINFYADKDKGESYGFRADGFGIAGGVERGTGFGAFGVSLALTSSDLEDPESMGEEQLSAQLLELGLYWRAQGVRWNTWARGAVGYASFDSVRQLVATGINRRNESDWNGYSVALAAGASYDYQTGRWSIRPEAIVEYFRLVEDEREETGGGNGFDLLIGDRTGHILSSTVAVNIGAGFGENRWLRPEVRLGWRQILSHDPGDTVATFRATGSPFTLSGDSLEGGGPIVGLRLNLGNDLGFLAVEADAELLDSYVRYALLLRASFRF